MTASVVLTAEMAKVLAEPQIHSHITDVLPGAHPFAHELVYCGGCGRMVHCSNNECMTTWVESGKGNFCLPRFLYEFNDAGFLSDDLGLRSTAQVPSAQGWQPIESAPRDGTLLWLIEHGAAFGFRVPHQYQGRWTTDFDCGHWEQLGGGIATVRHPTHWMPLPPPPDPEQQNEVKPT